MAGGDQVAQPLGGVGIDFIVITGHLAAYSAARRSNSGSSRNLPRPWLHPSHSSPRTHFPHVLSPGQQA
jgi:hypothetical protein